MPRSRRYLRRRPRRVPRRRRGSNLRGSKSKVYKYKVNLLPTYLVNTPSQVAGVLAVVTDQTTLAPISTTTQTAPDATASGISGHYSFGQAFQFSLEDLQQYSKFTTQYDHWKLNSVTCKIHYTNNGNVTTEALSPTCWAAIDYDDAALPANQWTVVGRQGIRRFEFNDRSRTSYTITFKPKCSGLVANTTGVQPPAMLTRGWLDCNQPGIVHHGLKLWWENVCMTGSGGENNSCIQYEFVYNLSFKQPINVF